LPLTIRISHNNPEANEGIGILMREGLDGSVPMKKGNPKLVIETGQLIQNSFHDALQNHTFSPPMLIREKP
jgi:hypothetical protein